MATHTQHPSSRRGPPAQADPRAAQGNHQGNPQEKVTKGSSASAPRKIKFNVGNAYHVVDVIGEGAYGVVVSAVHRPSGTKVAIKKVTPFDHSMFALRTLRELKLLKYFASEGVCENIISVLDIIKPTSYEDFREVYLVQELLETDLHRVIRTQDLSDDHCQYFLYQTCRALKALHSANIIHRDLKPSNLLLNANCDLKVCDFGLARSTEAPLNDDKNGFMTEYVATRWYRAPEVMLSFRKYTKSIDVWSVGCILAEMLNGKPLFPGKDYHNQLELILNVLGTPTIDEFNAITSSKSKNYIRQMPFHRKRSFTSLYPNASPAAIDFLTRTLTCASIHFKMMLTYPVDPRTRFTVEDCLRHPYLEAYHDPEDEPTAAPLDRSFFEFDDRKDEITREELKQLLYDEIMDFELV
ncbi:kinase-like domain-containing protein [Naematelia encephala]|uniref:Mitogen-activated protein kinase n=1 Tax=Naematelia encephala TaxID=71784 RepID=A0A1Y2AKG4_9TREE|nr:kinase-like domain-containing protein [Naematelia encephala]